MDYMIGDLHFGDKSILKLERTQFKTVEEMNMFLIQKWNSVVTDADTVFVNGDLFGYCGADYIEDVIQQLKGKIVLIVGNHDVDLVDAYRKAGIEVITYPILYNGYYIVSHEPLFVCETSPYINIYAHVHSNPSYKDVSCRSMCISADRINYTPIPFSEIRNKIREL